MRYAGILRSIQAMPWLIHPDKLEEIVSVLHRYAATDGRPEANLLIDEETRKPEMHGDVAVIPIFGTIAPRMNMLSALSGGASAEVLRVQVQSAADDEAVKAILLDIDSPGGAAYGTPELGDTVFRARGKKPVVASINPKAFSAAYWVASQASEIVALPSSETGSIGAIFIHQEGSQALEKEGIKTTLIRSSPFKAEANPFEPLTEEARAELERMAGILGEDFYRAVARGRGMPIATVRKDFGLGRVVMAREALERKMIDRIETPEETMDRLQSPRLRDRVGQGPRMTARALEAGLRESFGFSHEIAKAIASRADDLLGAREEHPESDVRDERPDSAAVREERAETIQREVGSELLQHLQGISAKC